jgi:hypothetical protein
MRDLCDFSVKEWLRLRPFVYGLKQMRNDLVQGAFLKARPENWENFLRDNEHFKGKNILQIVAFEQPEVLDFSIKMGTRNLIDASLLVFDNSRSPEGRAKIELVCRKHNVPYLSLPPNPSRHANRSHGMAMTWIWENVVKALRPTISGFIDHDLFPLEKLNPAETLQGQPFYGVPMVGRKEWSLWAGYCLYDFNSVNALPFNFLNDFSRGLDTGGRNWNRVYKNHDRRQLKFASWQVFDLLGTSSNSLQRIEIIDGCWMHLAGVSYRKDHPEKSEIYQRIKELLDGGANWPQLVALSGGAHTIRPTDKEDILASKKPRWLKHEWPTPR